MTATNPRADSGAPATPSTLVKTGYAQVNGLEMYFEIHGAGRPLVLLHGSLSATDTSFGRLLPSLAETRQVISLEQQAHGEREKQRRLGGQVNLD